ncbi:hypothetical protein LTR97_010539 [Elasticomyces elasticus]|uniref:Amidohydrolase-related domain-containing protein n=1 Tax=Elasticomyces elasticus TaxID=574655 RepID=A0AAN8A0P4_9PEZI|nr:hypothetical protein LTR97_010539 [Elasticomyces elasticus]
MAAAFLRSHGIDIDNEMHRIQFADSAPHPEDANKNSTEPTGTVISNASLPSTPRGSLWTVQLDPHSKTISTIQAYSPESTPSSGHNTIDAHQALLCPSLCHPHIHLDKAFLLSHPRHSHLQIQRGDFAEAMEMTGKAKANFTHEDLLERGQRVVDESVAAGVTHMRAFVELDAGVGTKCLDAGLELKRRAEGSQGDEDGKVIRGLMEEAAGRVQVEAVGSTPYVEGDREKMEKNVEWMVDVAIEHKKHIDFHLDYNLDAETEPLVWHVVSTLHAKSWTTSNPGKTVVLGHCTRLTLFSDDEWRRLKTALGDLPISFVGLPTSDQFIMGKTLPIPKLIKEYGLNACMGVNNIGNAFTPHGSCDPLMMACSGVGVYQAGTEGDADTLMESVSTRARAAIGCGQERRADDYVSLRSREGDGASLVLLGHEEGWRTRKSVAEAVYLYDHCRSRRSFLDGKMVV